MSNTANRPYECLFVIIIQLRPSDEVNIQNCQPPSMGYSPEGFSPRVITHTRGDNFAYSPPQRAVIV